MAQPTNRTSTKDFALFKRVCTDCIRRWGIVGWRVEFCHEDLDGTKLAQCATRTLARVAWLTLRKSWPANIAFDVSRQALINVARHEATHLLLAPLVDIVSARYLTADAEEHANESVCRHLQGLLP